MKIRFAKYFLLIFLVFLFSCELGPPGLVGPDGLTGADGEPGLDGANGANGGIVPGGIVSLTLVQGTPLLPASVVSITIMFDDDEICGEGDELYVNIDFTPFLTGINEAAHSLTWSGPNIPPGMYYVYAWIEIGAVNGVFDAAGDEPVYNSGAVQVYDPSGRFFDTPGLPATIESTNYLSPNYLVTDYNASQIDFFFYYETPLA